jgi:hypothetical protein
MSQEIQKGVDMLGIGEEKRRKPFPLSTKRIEWMLASHKDPYGKLCKTSECRQCHIKLTWGDRSYEFDHKDNNEANNKQINCYLVCRNCHGKATKIVKRKVSSLLGVSYETKKVKIGYKKPKKSTKKAKAKVTPKAEKKKDTEVKLPKWMQI